MTIPVKPISELEVKSTVSADDKILILDSVSEEARLADKTELKGDKGDKGDKWDKGDTGAQGAQGPKWDKGDKGDKGADGAKWDKWDKWDTGPQGPVWPQGPAGTWSWDVIWPSGATDWDIAVFDNVTGKLIKDSWKKPSDYLLGANYRVIKATTDTAFNTQVKVCTTAAGNYTPVEWDVLSLTFNNGCWVGSPKLNIDNSWEHSISVSTIWANAATLWLGMSKISWMFVYDWSKWITWPVKDSTYSAGSGVTISSNTISADTTVLATKAELWTAAAANTWTSSGNVPVLDSNGKLATSTIPWVALTDTFTVSTSSDLTNLSSAEQWDIAIVTTENKTYVLSAAPYSTAANWKEILSPTWWVTSVNGNTGAVTVSEFTPWGTATTGYVVTKTADWYAWAATSGWDVQVSSQANNILTTWMKIRAGTETDYSNLGTRDSNCLYLTIE